MTTLYAITDEYGAICATTIRYTAQEAIDAGIADTKVADEAELFRSGSCLAKFSNEGVFSGWPIEATQRQDSIRIYLKGFKAPV